MSPRLLILVLKMAKTLELLGVLPPGPPTRGLAFRPHPFTASRQAAQTSNLTENFYILIYAPTQLFFFYALKLCLKMFRYVRVESVEE